MTDKKKIASEKRTSLPREASYTDDFLDDWEKISRSGRHDMRRIKEVMILLVANDTALPAEWKDHSLKGELQHLRECHIKGDLLLVYQIHRKRKCELVAFYRVGTHSEIFG